MADQDQVLQALAAEILIPVEEKAPSYYLGPVGISDPSEFIAAESQRIPFKTSLTHPRDWQDTFKNWPLPPIAGWRNWYKRIFDDKSPQTKNWDNLHIAHCLELSLAETPKNENLLIAACHFWSNGVNAFLFGHGPMSPTLADVYMITGLNITESLHPYNYKGSSKQTGVKTGVGYKRYIQNYMSDGPLTEVEYRAFLNMWLCRFIFCGKANEPTLNHIVMAEDLAAGKLIPLGKYLLGSVYHMLHQTIRLMHSKEKISCVNGPWWFIQMWLQLYMHQIVTVDINNRHFPSINYKEGEAQSTKGCQTYGEAASTITVDKSIGELFELFFKGFVDPLWFPYSDNDNLTLPCEFSFETGCIDKQAVAIFNSFIRPCILPAEFCGGRLVQSTFEYYQPNMMARQLGCGQVPPRLFLHEFLKPREIIKDSAESRRIFDYKCFTSIYAPKPFVPIKSVHPSFTLWWQELHDHIFNLPVHPLCSGLMSDYYPASEDIVPAPLARSIAYNTAGPISALGFKSTSLAQLMSRQATLDPIITRPSSVKRKASLLPAPSTFKRKRTSNKKPIQAQLQPSAIAPDSADASLTVNPVLESPPHHNPAPTSPEPEVVISPRSSPISSQHDVPSPSHELERSSSPMQEIRNDEKSASSPSYSFAMDEFIADQEEETSSNQTLSKENQAKLKNILSLLHRDIQDQVKDADLLRDILESIDQDLPADIKSSLDPVSQLDNHFAAVKQALKNQSAQPALEQKRAMAKQSIKDLHSKTQSNKKLLANLQSALESKEIRKAELEAELKSLSAEIEADKKKIAEIPSLTEQMRKKASAILNDDKQTKAKLSLLAKTQEADKQLLENISSMISNAENVILKYLDVQLQ